MARRSLQVVLQPCDASAADRDDGLLVTRHAIVSDHAPAWPEAITTAENWAFIASSRRLACSSAKESDHEQHLRESGVSMSALTAAINIPPNNYDRLEDGAVRRPPSAASARSSSRKERRAQPACRRCRGSPGTVLLACAENAAALIHIPHIPHDDVVLPEEVQGIRAFGTGNRNRDGGRRDGAAPSETMRNKHAITLEHLRYGKIALRG